MPRPADPLARSKLLRAARQEFASVGMSEARIEDIAKRADVSKGSFYLHFKSKEHAFHEIVDHFLVGLHQTASEYHPECVRTQGRSFSQIMDDFQGHDEHILEFLWANRDVMRMILNSGKVRAQYQNALDAFLDAQAEQIASAIKQLQDCGIYDPSLDAEVCAWLIAGGWFNIARRMTLVSSKPNLKSWAMAQRRLLSEALRTR